MSGQPKVSLDPESLPTLAAPMLATDGVCAYRSARGIAEVVGIDSDKILLRFYPGDRLFTRLPEELNHPGLRLGDEYRAWRNERVSGTCDLITYRLVDEPSMPADQQLAAVRGI